MFVSELISCQQAARLSFSYLLCIENYANSDYALNVLRKPRSINDNGLSLRDFVTSVSFGPKNGNPPKILEL